MADSASRRREHRRKKILENAENRLLKLTTNSPKITKPNDFDYGITDNLIRDSSAYSEDGFARQKMHSDPTCCKGQIGEDGRHQTIINEGRQPETDIFGDIMNADVVDSENVHGNLPAVLEYRKAFAALLGIFLRLVLVLFGKIAIFKYILTHITLFEIGLSVLDFNAQSGHQMKATQGYLSTLLVLLNFKNVPRLILIYNSCVAIFSDYAIFLFVFFLMHCSIENIAT